MYGLYTPIFLLQAFCVYHAYKSNAEQRWYWLIIFFPLVGCLIYLVHNFNNRATLDTLTENVKAVVISNYRIEQLERALRLSDSIKNKINLADAYVETGRYKDAIALYASCMQGFMSDDPSLRMKMLYAHFIDGDYNTAIAYGRQLESEKIFRNAEERIVYAWSLYHAGNTDLAESIFDDMDRSFTNYQHRMEYCKFLLKTGKKEQAKERLTVLIEEFDHMEGPERRLKKPIYREIKDLYVNNIRA